MANDERERERFYMKGDIIDLAPPPPPPPPFTNYTLFCYKGDRRVKYTVYYGPIRQKCCETLKLDTELLHNLDYF